MISESNKNVSLLILMIGVILVVLGILLMVPTEIVDIAFGVQATVHPYGGLGLLLIIIGVVVGIGGGVNYIMNLRKGSMT